MKKKKKKVDYWNKEKGSLYAVIGDFKSKMTVIVMIMATSILWKMANIHNVVS